MMDASFHTGRITEIVSFIVCHLKDSFTERHGAGYPKIRMLISLKKRAQVVKGVHVIPLAKDMYAQLEMAENCHCFLADRGSAPVNPMEYVGEEGSGLKPYQIIPSVRCRPDYCITLV